MNLGLSPQFAPISKYLTYPATMKVDYIRVYQLADEAPRLRTLAFRPGRTGLVYADRVAAQTPQVLLRSGIIIDELRRVRFGAALVMIGMS